MPGYRRRRTWRVRRAAKYSIQQKALQFAAAQGQTTTVAVVPSTVVEGMRKVKHITVNATVQGESDAFYWAIVYVPQGTTPNAIQISTSATSPGMYEPNQFCMNCGVVDGTAGPIRFGSPVARNSTMAMPSTFSSGLSLLRQVRTSPSLPLCAMLSLSLNLNSAFHVKSRDGGNTVPPS